MCKLPNVMSRLLEKIILLTLLNLISKSSAKSFFSATGSNFNPEHRDIREEYTQPHLTTNVKSLYGTPLWNSYYIPMKERSEHVHTEYGYGPHEVKGHHSHKEDEHGIVKVLNEFIGVMGPFLFPLPYFLAILPFAIPAIPLALWFDRTNLESHHPPPHPNMNMTEHSTEPSMSPSLPTTLKPTPTTPKQMPMTRPIPTNGTSKPTTTEHPPMMSSSNFTIISSNHTNSSTSNGLQPPIDFPQTPPLFPFPLFLNSSWLSVDYNGDQYWEHRSE